MNKELEYLEQKLDTFHNEMKKEMREFADKLHCANKEVKFDEDQYQKDLEEVRLNPDYLMNVNHQTLELCMIAVKQDGIAISFVKEQTPELCMEAVKQNEHALQYVKNQTIDLCLQAVKQNSDSLQYVNEEIKNTFGDVLDLMVFSNHVRKSSIDFLNEIEDNDSDDLHEKYSYTISTNGKEIVIPISSESYDRIESFIHGEIEDLM